METQKNADDESSQESSRHKGTAQWAKNAGYNVLADRLMTANRPRLRFGNAKQNPQPAANMATTTTTTTTAPKVLDLDFDAMELGESLKGGNAAKSVCRIKVDNTPYVLKGAAGTPEDHVQATAFMNSLPLAGVRTPKTRMLDANEKAGVIRSLTQQNDRDAQFMASALRDGEGQVSEQLSGTSANKIFLDGYIQQPLDAATTKRNAVLKLGQDAAWQQTAADAMKGSGWTFALMADKSVANRVEAWKNATDDATRKEAVAWMRDKLDPEVYGHLIDLLSDIDQGTVQDGKTRLDTEAQNRKTQQAGYSNFVASPEGMRAFAGIAAADLITGMNDRVSKNDWNGGNFLFDKQSNSLCCIDNNKKPELGLSSGTSDEWKDYFATETAGAKSLAAVLFERIYVDERGAPDAPSNIVKLDDKQKADGEAIFRQVLGTVAMQVEKNPDADPVAKERVAFLKARMVLDDIFEVPAKLSKLPDIPPKINLGTKLFRMANSATTSNKNDRRNDTKRIKEDLRNNRITAQQALAQLKALGEQTDGVSTDRRASKIKFLAAAMEFRDLLAKRQKELADFLKSDAPEEMKKAASLKGSAQPLRDAYAVWKAIEAKEGKLVALIDAVWKTFPNEVRNG